jgi:hypothetical protein
MVAPAGRKKGLLVDVDTGVVRRDHVLVQRAPGAVLVLGYGPRAEQLRRFACEEVVGDADPFIARCNGIARAIESGTLAKARRCGVPRAILEMQDRTLRRLAIAEAMAKAGFNPDEPRDERGRWTSEGGPARGGSAGGTGAGTAVAVATMAPTAAEWAFGGDVAPLSLLALAQLAARYSPAGVFLGTYFFGINRTYKTQGVVPDQPDITWEYDADTGAFTLLRDGEIFYAAQNQYGLIRDAQGRVVGRFVGGNMALDQGALSAAVSALDSESRAGTQPLTQTDTDRTEPKLCPTTTPESTKGRSAQAIAY